MCIAQNQQSCSHSSFICHIKLIKNVLGCKLWEDFAKQKTHGSLFMALKAAALSTFCKDNKLIDTFYDKHSFLLFKSDTFWRQTVVIDRHSVLQTFNTIFWHLGIFWGLKLCCVYSWNNAKKSDSLVPISCQSLKWTIHNCNIWHCSAVLKCCTANVKAI